MRGVRSGRRGRRAMRGAAHRFVELDGAQRVEVARELLGELGLLECADVRVGNVEKRGISGGQRKRVSLGLELITRPSVVMCDEPTSGLDSKMAEDVVALLRKISRDGCTVSLMTVCSHTSPVAPGSWHARASCRSRHAGDLHHPPAELPGVLLVR